MTVETILHYASWALLMGGAFFLMTGAIGVIRLPDVFTRNHAAGVTDTLGAALTLFGLMLQVEPGLVTVKLIAILAFLWFTSPVSGHALIQSALMSGRKPILAHNRVSAEAAKRFGVDAGDPKDGDQKDGGE